MRNLSKILAFAAISAASTVAYAGGDPYHHNHVMVHEGFMIGIDGGYGYLSTPEATYPNNFIDSGEPDYKYSSDVNAGDFVWGVHAGYDIKVKPTTLVGLEFGYKNLGHTNSSLAIQEYGADTYDLQGSRDYHQNAVDLLLTSSHYIYKGLHIVGKIGAAYVNSDVTQCATSDTSPVYAGIPLEALEGSNSIWRIEPELSLGVGYTFYNHVDVHAAYTYIGGANDQPLVSLAGIVDLPKARVYSTNLLMVGVSYTF